MAAVNSFVNGVPSTSLALADRGLHYGHGLFETARLAAGHLPLWAYHLRRLAADAPRLGIPFAADVLEAQLSQCLAVVPADGVLKIMVTAGTGPRGYRTPEAGAATHVIQYFPPLAAPAAAILQPCAYTLPDNPRLAGIKHLNRLDQVLAAQELAAGHDGLLLNARGEVIETLSGNVFVRYRGQWLTPATTQAGVAGVMRAYLCAQVLPSLGIAVATTSVTLAQLAAADELFICNAVAGVRPVAAVKGVGHWPEGADTTAIRALLAAQVPCFAA